MDVYTQIILDALPVNRADVRRLISWIHPVVFKAVYIVGIVPRLIILFLCHSVTYIWWIIHCFPQVGNLFLMNYSLVSPGWPWIIHWFPLSGHLFMIIYPLFSLFSPGWSHISNELSIIFPKLATYIWWIIHYFPQVGHIFLMNYPLFSPGWPHSSDESSIVFPRLATFFWWQHISLVLVVITILQIDPVTFQHYSAAAANLFIALQSMCSYILYIHIHHCLSSSSPSLRGPVDDKLCPLWYRHCSVCHG